MATGGSENAVSTASREVMRLPQPFDGAHVEMISRRIDLLNMKLKAAKAEASMAERDYENYRESDLGDSQTLEEYRVEMEQAYRRLTVISEELNEHMATLKEAKRTGNRPRSSSASILSIKEVDMDLEEQLVNERQTFEEALQSVNNSIEEMSRMMETTEDKDEWKRLRLELQKLNAEKEKLSNAFTLKQKHLKERAEVSKKRIELEGESEQQLDAGDLRVVENWNVSSGRNEAKTEDGMGTQGAYYQPMMLPPSAPVDRDALFLEMHQATMQFLQRKGDRRLPEFTGDPMQWDMFVSEFHKTTREQHLSDRDNIQRLQHAIKGNARKIVEHLLGREQNVCWIMSLLERHYGRPELVLDNLQEKAKTCARVIASKPETLVQFGIILEALVSNIETYGKNEYFANPQLVRDLVEKLPDELQKGWIGYLLSNPGKERTIKEFHAWISYHINIARIQSDPNKLNIVGKEEKKDEKKKKCSIQIGMAEETNTEKPGGCYFCGDSNHYAYKCDDFRKKSVEDRWKVVKEKKVCFVCFSRKHRSDECERDPCKKDGCGKAHNHLLHENKKRREDKGKGKGKKQDTSSSRSSPSEDDEALLERLLRLQESKGTKETAVPKESESNVMGVAVSSASLPIIPVKVKGSRGTAKIFALLDCGASFTVMENSVADKIGLSGPLQDFSFTVFGKERRCSGNSQIVEAAVAGDYYNATGYNLTGIRTVDDLGLPSFDMDFNALKEKFPHLRRAKAKSFTDATPQMVIGTNYFQLIRPQESLEIEMDKPAAYKSKLGWYIIKTKDGKDSCQLLLENMEEALDMTVKEYFSTESFGVIPLAQKIKSADVLRAEKILEETTRRVNGRWETGLLWKQDDINMPPSYDMALRRFHAMDRKMVKNPTFSALCQEKFEEYIRKGFLVESRNEPSSHRWYLPWFFAYHPTKKPRLVFDAAAKSCGRSLNDCLLSGPDLILSLASVLARFRLHQVALTADIKSMFHQVRLKKEDMAAQTILYRGNNRMQKPTEYEMTALFFGSASSPCSAIFCKNRNAEEYKEKYPEAVRVIKEDFYVDDLASGAETSERAITLYEELHEIHTAGNFPLVKWNSSSANVLAAIPEEQRSAGEVTFANKGDIPTEKILGLCWNSGTDELSFKVCLRKVPEKLVNGEDYPTKRQVTSVVMSVFDPLGFVAPLKVKGMLLLQMIWRSKIGWDDCITSEDFMHWKKWLKELKTLGDVKIPRKLSPIKLSEVKSIQLHTFCDASQEAFAAVSYVRLDVGDTFHVAFVLGKVRVGPLRKLTIPKMELQAATMASRLANSILKMYEARVKIDECYFWSDSKTVLCWIRRPDEKLKVFVANRVGEIVDSTKQEDWHWISTKDNVADVATRMSINFDLSNQEKWLKGPAFLWKPKEEWNLDAEPATANPPEDSLNVCMQDDPEYLPDAGKYSSWYRLLRATAMRYVVARRFAMRIGKSSGPLYMTSEDLERAKMLWIKHSQRQSFPKELRRLRNEKNVEDSSLLAPLNPILDERGIIVMDGRLKRAELSDKLKNPPILDKRERYTTLMIEWHHRCSHHFGQERVINELRKEAWILGVRQAVRKCKFECIICKKNFLKPTPPLMGQLPQARMEMGQKPFYSTGVDYFGPIIVKRDRRTRMNSGTVKRWGAIFTCMTTRAVHLEVAQSLESDEMLNVLTRFINRRGEPANIYSDNGTNFVGAEREMREQLAKWNTSEIQAKTLQRGVTWHFNPPASPHMGGSWESPIKSVKKILYSQMDGNRLKESELITYFTEVENILNSRPLTRASPDPDDLESLTPNHLLHIPCVIGPTIASAGLDKRLKRSWELVQRLAQEFWKRFSEEYLPWLAKRQKWNKKTRPLQVGDVCLLLDDNAPRNQWKTGVITAIFPAKDGQVRFVDLKLAFVDPTDKKKEVKISYLRRPAMKVCSLIPNKDLNHE